MPVGHNRKGRSKNSGHFVQLHDYMLMTEAWISLSPSAVKVFVELKRRYRGSNNGHIPFAIREGKKIGLSTSATKRALDELVEKGFLKVAKDSTFDQKRLAREWLLIDTGCNGQQATHDYRKWRSHRAENSSGNLKHSAAGGTYSAADGTVTIFH